MRHHERASGTSEIEKWSGETGEATPRIMPAYRDMYEHISRVSSAIRVTPVIAAVRCVDFLSARPAGRKQAVEHMVTKYEVS